MYEYRHDTSIIALLEKSIIRETYIALGKNT